MNIKYAFIDESGDESLELSLPGISSFYVVCGLVISPEHLDATGQRFREVKDKYFKNREMKSAGVADLNLRQRVLQELAGAEFSVHLLVGNKGKITTPGLRYPKSFIKYLHHALYQQLATDYSVEIRADKIKNSAFMAEMQSYLEKQQLIDLFNGNSFVFVDSKEDVFIQATDFIAGSIRACFERNEFTALNDPMLAQLRWKIVQFIPFPTAYGNFIAKIPGFGEYDQVIESRAVAQAEEFLQVYAGSNEVERELQCVILRRLLQQMVLNDSDWVSTEELMADLNTIAAEPVTEQAFRGLIGHLRDASVLIASRHGKWGYKLPTSLADLVEFLNRQNNQLAPMITRIRKAREIIARATDNAVDILATPGFENLKAMVDVSPLFGSQDTMEVLQNQDTARLGSLLSQCRMSVSGGGLSA